MIIGLSSRGKFLIVSFRKLKRRVVFAKRRMDFTETGRKKKKEDFRPPLFGLVAEDFFQCQFFYFAEFLQGFHIDLFFVAKNDVSPMCFVEFLTVEFFDVVKVYSLQSCVVVLHTVGWSSVKSVVQE